MLAKEVKSLRKELEAERAKRTAAEKQLSDVTSQAAASEASSSSQEKQLGELQARLASSKAELAGSQESLAAAKQDLTAQVICWIWSRGSCSCTQARRFSKCHGILLDWMTLQLSYMQSGTAFCT